MNWFHFHRWTKWEIYSVWGQYIFLGGLLKGDVEQINMKRRSCEKCGDLQECEV